MFFSTNTATSTSTKNGTHDLDHSFHLPISFFPFPSPFEVDFTDQFDEYDFLFHQQQQPHNFSSIINSHNYNNPPPPPPPIITSSPTNTNTNMAIINSDQKMKKVPRKRLSKKDRHSKITTARGLRDRRMRLSLPVARQFFGLQDMLGVDKGSKTVEWLLIQAKPEILKLAQQRNCKSIHFCSNNSNSEVSGIDEVGVMIGGAEENGEDFVKKMKSLKSGGKNKKRVNQPARKTILANKELRKLARARARARTMEKKNQKITSSSWSSSQFETGEETSHQPIIDYQLIQRTSSSFEIMPKWSPSADSTFNYLHQIETLDLQEQHEFEDSEIFG